SAKSSFASVLKEGNKVQVSSVNTEPALVLDESCIKEYDFSSSLMGKIKDNWTLLQLKRSFLTILVLALGSLLSSKPLTPLKAMKGSYRWKIIVQGKVFWICAKEMDAWTLTFHDDPHDESSDDESQDDGIKDIADDKEANGLRDGTKSEDLFNIYDMLNGQHKKASNLSNELEFPPGFTPINHEGELIAEESVHDVTEQVQSISNKLKKRKPNAGVLNQSSLNTSSQKIAGGSILEAMDEQVKVGQTMGYNMEGYTKNIEAIIGSQGETKMENIDAFSIKDLWGNLNFDYVVGSLVGFSGGIVCVWDPSKFIQEHVSKSDYFVALMGIWSPSSTKLLVISVYAPQELREKRDLWNYLRSFIDRLKKKLQCLKNAIKVWVRETRTRLHERKTNIKLKPSDVGKIIDQGKGNEEVVNSRSILLKELQDLSSLDATEISQKAKDCGANKSPGPDGFTFEFFRKFWRIIDQDVFQDVFEFFKNGHIPRGCNSSFIALIPKIQDAKLVKDFRPISLIESVYKIITKILANIMYLVLPSLISEVQSAFVSNRQILDGPFILNELLSWSFGFGQKLCKWILGCLENAIGSVLVNGSPTLEFQFPKGALDSCNTMSRRSPWLDIIQDLHSLKSKGIDLMQFIRKKVGNGENTSFWDENWLGDDIFKSIYPRLYALEEHKSISVADKLQHPSLVHSFRRLPRGGVEEVQLDSLRTRTSVVTLPNMVDR
ncbi:hypothetical protein Tco_0349176, partial [Tanacetum coccineum]